MSLLKVLPFKVSVPKPKRNKTSDCVKRITNRIAKGKVFQDENGVYKVAITINNDDIHPDLYVLEFTEKSYDLTGRINVFSRTDHTRFIRDKFRAKTLPGSPEKYIPFAPNWEVKGYIVIDKGVRKFDFKSLIGIGTYVIESAKSEYD